METRLIQVSSVVVGRAHNPSILNPDFLNLNGIVPKEWEVADTLTTPQLAVVRYVNGISVTVEHNKLQVVDLGDSPAPQNSRVSTITSKYVETLPHVTYVAVGNNFQSLVPVQDPGEFLKRHFLKAGPWDMGLPALEAAGIRLVYAVPGGRLVLSFDAGQAEKLDGAERVPESVILLNGNFHRDCGAYPAKDEVLGFLSRAGQDYETYRTLVASVLG
jgi:hypothetical protein